MDSRFRKQAGFTLIEMIIVVLLLGILAMIIIPQITVSTGEARLNTMRTNLNAVRSAIELYYHQHSNIYPGVVQETDGSTAASTDVQCLAAFMAQLTTYSQLNGKADPVRTALTGTIFGPYLKTVALPQNPFNEDNTATCDVVVTNVTTRTAVPGDTTGWRFYQKTGVFIANDHADHEGY